MSWFPRTAPLLALVLLVVLACSDANSSGPASAEGPLFVGVLPSQSKTELVRIYTPLLEYMERDSGLEFELVIPDSYADLLDRVAAGQLQLGWFGGLTFLRAEQLHGMRPLAMRDVDLDFTSSFLVSSASSAASIEDLAGGSIAFGPRLSTSGNLMPRYFLGAEGIVVETLFSEIRHTAAHDETAFAVLKGDVDVGVLNSQVLQAMLADGRLPRDDVRILGITPPYRDYVWAASPSLGRDGRRRVLDALLSLDIRIPEHAAILERFGSEGFVPASRADYGEIRLAAEREGLLQEGTP